MAITVCGPNHWELERDEDGHRTYSITHRVRSDTSPGVTLEGPAAVMAADGLPEPGDSWDFFGDRDAEAVCTHEAEVRPVLREEPYIYFDVTQKFTSKPFNFCQGGSRDDPTSYPAEISIGTRKVRQEAALDAYGWPLLSSSYEQLRGSAVERERSITVVTVKKNIPGDVFSAPLYTRLRDKVNSVPMWGFDIGKVLFADFDADKKYTARCGVYFDSRFVFEIDEEGWSKEAADEGLKVLRGAGRTTGWTKQPDGTYVYEVDPDADPHNPADFVQYKDPTGENAHVRLNGAGLPAGVIVARTGLFVCVAAGTGRPVTNKNYWLAVRGGYDDGLYRETGDLWVLSYAPGQRIPKGRLALDPLSLTDAYVATDDEPAGGPAPAAADWLALPLPVLTVAGLYDSGTTYAVGDVVDGSREETTQGYVPVVLYTAVDLLGQLSGVIPPDLVLAE